MGMAWHGMRQTGCVHAAPHPTPPFPSSLLLGKGMWAGGQTDRDRDRDTMPRTCPSSMCPGQTDSVHGCCSSVLPTFPLLPP